MYDGTDFLLKFMGDLERAFLFGVEKEELPQSLSSHVQIPCGQVLGMGERCSHGYLCGMCEYVLKLEERLRA